MNKDIKKWSWFLYIIKQFSRPFHIISMHPMAFFLWLAFTLFGGLIGIIVSIIRNTLFGGLCFSEALFLESKNGSLYTYSIAMVAAVLSSVFITFAESKKLRFRRQQIVTITISIFVLFFSGVFYALSMEAPAVSEIRELGPMTINWKLLCIVVIAILVSIYSFCVCRLDSHEDQFKDITDPHNKEDYVNDNQGLPKDAPSNN